jgi:hypothetical protein
MKWGFIAFYDIHHPTKVNEYDPQGKLLVSLTSDVVVNSISASYEI